MIGIKGVGMTMLARFFAGNNIEVIGSDTAEVFMTDEPLRKAGVKILENFAPENIPKDADLIIYSTAYNAERNAEVAAALAGKVRTLTYAAAMGEVFNQKYGIAVIGSHGKTTTTAWLGFVLNRAGLAPNAMVGSIVPQWDGPSLVSGSDILIIEADEYQNKLQYFNPRAVLLNNIDYDHPDFFPTPQEYKNVFIEFIKKIPAKGFLIANFDDPIIRSVAGVNCRGKVVSYGIENQADYAAYDLRSFDGRQFFKVRTRNEDGAGESAPSELGDFSIQLAGKHNISNALAVIAAAIELETPLAAIREHLGQFTGTARRMQRMGEYNGALIYDDYAHHPAEIKATLSGLRQLYPKNKLTVVFHPHTFTRTKALLGGFAESFDSADKVIILDIYGSAREAQGGVHSRDLVAKMKNKNFELIYLPALADAEAHLREELTRDEVLVLMGAGDVFRVGEMLLQ